MLHKKIDIRYKKNKVSWRVYIGDITVGVIIGSYVNAKSNHQELLSIKKHLDTLNMKKSNKAAKLLAYKGIIGNADIFYEEVIGDIWTSSTTNLIETIKNSYF